MTERSLPPEAYILVYVAVAMLGALVLAVVAAVVWGGV